MPVSLLVARVRCFPIAPRCPAPLDRLQPMVSADHESKLGELGQDLVDDLCNISYSLPPAVPLMAFPKRVRSAGWRLRTTAAAALRRAGAMAMRRRLIAVSRPHRPQAHLARARTSVASVAVLRSAGVWRWCSAWSVLTRNPPQQQQERREHWPIATHQVSSERGRCDRMGCVAEGRRAPCVRRLSAAASDLRVRFTVV